MNLHAIQHYFGSLCDYACWILSFNGASRLLWLSLVWFILEFITRLMARKNGIPKAGYRFVKSKDRGSWWLVAFSSILMFSIILFFLHVRWPADLPDYLIPVGIILMCLGIALRIWAVATLGKFFTMHVMIFSNHQLIDKGPYRWLRHPSYAGVFLITIGLGLATGYLFVLLSFLIILAFALGYRIYVEEKALKEEFGSEWTAYSAKTWRLIPWVW